MSGDVNVTVVPAATGASNEERLDRLETNQKSIVQKLDRNNEVTEWIWTAIQTGKTGLRVLGWLGVAAKWIASIAGGFVAMGAAYHYWTSK